MNWLTGTVSPWAILLLTIILLGSGSGQTSLGSGSFTTTDGSYSANWTMIDANTIAFTISAMTSGWVSIGWSVNPRGHLNTAAVVAWVGNDGATTIIDGFSATSRRTPTPANFIDSVGVTGTQSNGRTSVAFRHPIKSMDAQHVPIINGDMYLVWAYGATDGTSASAYVQHSTSTRGLAKVNFLAKGGVTIGNAITMPTYLFGLITDPASGISIVTALVLVILAVVLRLYKLKKRWREAIRRKAFRGFMGPAGFADGLDLVERSSVAQSKRIFNKDVNPELSRNNINDPFQVSSVSASSGQFPFLQKTFGPAPIYDDPGSDLNDTSNDDLTLNIVPSGGFFRGSEPVSFSDKSSSSPPLDVYIVDQKPISSPVKNALVRFWRLRLSGSQLALKHVILFASFLAVNAFWLGLWIWDDGDIGIGLGYVATANAFWVAIPATRNSAMSLIFEIPIDRAITFHRWLGRLVVASVIAHGLWEIIPQLRDVAAVDVVLMDQTNLTGVVSGVSALVILFTSFQSLRRHLFQFFFYSHFVFILFYLFMVFHAKANHPYVFAAVAVYTLDRVLRLARGDVIPFRATQVQTLPGNVVRLRFPKRKYATYTAGQYVFVNFPTIALLEWHPFSLSSGPKDDLCEIHVKSLGNTTRALLNSIQGNLSVVPPLIRVEGPYGHLSSRYKRYSHVLLIGGGVGITPLISIIKDIYQLEMSLQSKAKHARSAWIKHVYLVWSVPTEFEWAWFAETLVKARVLASAPGYPQITIAGHITQQKSTADPSLIIGRPDLETIFRYVEGTMMSEPDPVNAQPPTESSLRTASLKGRAVVYTCGPRIMVDEAWDLARKRTRGQCRFDFHHEVFNF